jgi:oligoendopeptidase F
MLPPLPTSSTPFMDWSWDQIQPYFDELAARDLTHVESWLSDWTYLSRLLSERAVRLQLGYHQNTTDKEAEARLFADLEAIVPNAEAAGQKLREKLLNSGLTPQGMEIPLRAMRADAELFREENLPIQVELQKLATQYDKILGAQTVEWEGNTIPIPQLRPVMESPDREKREKAWWLARERQLADRETLNDLWRQMYTLRQQIAANAGYPDYRSYIWQAYNRFDYTPEDCLQFHEAIEKVAVPAATRIYKRLRDRMGLDTLRPWDLTNGSWTRPANPPDTSPLHPYTKTSEFLEKCVAMFQQVNPQLGQHFRRMVDENFMDTDNRMGKAPGGYCTYFAVERHPYIFMNAVGTHTDVQTMMHEAGHAFHAFEASHLPHLNQLYGPMEFSEVASMGMELLAAPYLTHNGQGIYSPRDAARARLEHLDTIVLFWPYMAVMDAFQHWAYTHPEDALDTEQCDAKWHALWRRFLPAVDWTGLEAELVTGWHRQLHIFHVPFYYVEYGLAQMGAVQVWRNSLNDPTGAIAAYRRALALGGTATLPELYQTAGIHFAFDAKTLGEVVELIEMAIAELETTL